MIGSRTQTVVAALGLKALHSRRSWLIAIVAAAVLLAAAAYLGLSRTAPTEESALQSAVVRQGDLIISAVGSGTLTAPEEELGFTGSGEMTVIGVYVTAGELVQRGQLLAEVDGQQARLDLEEAQRAYANLTSTTAQAAALRQAADAQARVQSSKLHLEYLIGPDVMYWETEIAEGQETLKAAQAQLEAAPSSEEARKAAEKAQAFLDFAGDQLSEAWERYYDEYVPMTFGISVDGDVDTYNVPSELEITQARADIQEAAKQLQESQELYAVLMGEAMPEETLNPSLLQVMQAKRTLDEAQANVDGSIIIAPFDGTVMSVSISGGDIVEVAHESTSSSVAQSSSSQAVMDPLAAALMGGNAVDSTSDGDDTRSAEDVIILADTHQPYLDVYWDESDWSLLKVGSEVEITFDDRPDEGFTGAITEIDRELYTGTSSTAIRGEVSLEAPFTELHLPVGAIASAEVISQRAEDAILIPIEALHETTPGSYMVFVLKDGEVRLRAVQVGLMDQVYAQITSGLTAGEVVTTGLVKASSGE